MTSIPRSTVGYYVRKFNMAAKKGRAVQLVPSTKNQPDDILFGLFSKAKSMELLLGLLKKDNAQTIYYTLAGFKLFSEMFGRLGADKGGEGTLLINDSRRWRRRRTQIVVRNHENRNLRRSSVTGRLFSELALS